jgi:hypothetical protein
MEGASVFTFCGLPSGAVEKQSASVRMRKHLIARPIVVRLAPS